MSLNNEQIYRSPSQAAAVAILMTADVLRRRFAAALEPHGITPQQYHVLRILHDSGGKPLPTLDIGARLIEQTPGITRLLDRLVQKEFVRRDRPASDRRIVHCWITPTGAELLKRLDAEVYAIEDATLDGFEPDEMDAFMEMLEAVRLSAGIRIN